MKTLTIPKKLAIVNDLSGFGRCSLTVAIPIISAMKVQACPVVTSYFSNHTGYPSYYCKDLSSSMSAYFKQWNQLHLSFDGIYCGYLSDSAQIQMITQFIQTQKERNPDFCIIIDPVMGDNGARYLGVSDSLCAEMKSFVSLADILTPNLTEACLLTDTAYQKHFGESELCLLAQKLKQLGAKKIVITGIPGNNVGEATISNFVYESETCYQLLSNVISGENRPGTGDIFSSIIAANAVKHKDFVQSVKEAATFISLCIQSASSLHIPVSDGVCFENFLDRLL